MSDDAPRETTGLRTAAFVLASAVIGGPLIALLLTRAILWQLNPRGLDLRDPASYEVEVWIPSAVIAAVLVIAVAVVFSRLARSDRPALRYPALVLQLQVGIAIAAVALLLLTPGIGF